jgi:predicted nucleotidyltransferase
MDHATIEKAADLLAAASPPGTGIILFGSQARGDADPASDVDFLVVEPEVRDRALETMRLRDVLRPHRIRASVLVVSRKTWEDWRATPNTILHEAWLEGREIRWT